jgi:hypothetical protein
MIICSGIDHFRAEGLVAMKEQHFANRAAGPSKDDTYGECACPLPVREEGGDN